MSTFNVVQASHSTLVAATVDIVNLSSPASLIVISNRSAASGDIYWRYSAGGQAVAPTVGGADSFIVPAGQTRSYTRPSPTGVTQVKLISASTPDYSVEGF